MVRQSIVVLVVGLIVVLVGAVVGRVVVVVDGTVVGVLEDDEGTVVSVASTVVTLVPGCVVTGVAATVVEVCGLGAVVAVDGADVPTTRVMLGSMSIVIVVELLGWPDVVGGAVAGVVEGVLATTIVVSGALVVAGAGSVVASTGSVSGGGSATVVSGSTVVVSAASIDGSVSGGASDDAGAATSDDESLGTEAGVVGAAGSVTAGAGAAMLAEGTPIGVSCDSRTRTACSPSGTATSAAVTVDNERAR